MGGKEFLQDVIVLGDVLASFLFEIQLHSIHLVFNCVS